MSFKSGSPCWLDLDKGTAARLVAAVDTDGNGQISVKEFVSHFEVPISISDLRFFVVVCTVPVDSDCIVRPAHTASCAALLLLACRILHSGQ